MRQTTVMKMVCGVCQQPMVDVDGAAEFCVGRPSHGECRCGAKMVRTSSGYVCSRCNGRLIPRSHVDPVVDGARINLRQTLVQLQE